MLNPIINDLTEREYPGFTTARNLMHCYESRALVAAHLRPTVLFTDPNVATVHIDNTSRLDRCILTGYDRSGGIVRADTIYLDLVEHRLDVVAEFDHGFNKVTVPEESDLGDHLRMENGWVVCMDAVRSYNPMEDSRQTLRKIVLAGLPDLIAHGDAHQRPSSESDDQSWDPDINIA